jgi:23S rRNA (adenine-N6)-dimethyltransferase
VRPGDLVVDLGAGTGELTGPLLDVGARVVAVELHPGRAQALRRRYGDRVTVVRADLRELRLPRQPFRVVASPPYQLSSQVVTLLLSTDRLLSADLVLQRATARRLASAPPGARHAKRFRLDLGRPVPRSAFTPPPHVDSSVLRIIPRRTAR